jgi:hypothetical protein
MSKCPFEDNDFTLDINTPCPVCGMLGSFIYDNPSDDTCVGNIEIARIRASLASVSGSGESQP